jgi:hypothetical protein
MSIELAAGGPNFAANRDNRGAFATGSGSEARNIGAQTYIENNFGPKVSQPPSWPLSYDLPDLPNRYQVRESDVVQVRTKLLGSGTAIGITSVGRAIGLKGMGGIGKTVLATALVHDPSVRDAFPDGVVWLTVGRNVPVLAKAAELAFALTGGRLVLAARQRHVLSSGNLPPTSGCWSFSMTYGNKKRLIRSPDLVRVVV